LQLGGKPCVSQLAMMRPANLRYGKSRPVDFDSGGPGRSIENGYTMARKWTKASRAKLSRSQKARWRELKRQQKRKRPKR